MRSNMYLPLARNAGVRRLRYLLVLLASLALGCGDDATSPDVPADALLVTEMTSTWTGRPYDWSHVGFEEGGDAVLRSRVEVLLSRDAQVVDLERILDLVGGEIVATVTGVSGAVIEIPDPGTLAALDLVVETLQDDAAVWFVRRAVFPTGRTLPGNEPVSGPRVELRHHLAVRAHAAWNAAGAMVAQPNVIVADFFGGGPPRGLGAVIDPSQYTNNGHGPAYPNGFISIGGTPPPPSGPSWHGYHVTGIAVANFGGDSSVNGRVTGMIPGPSRLHAAEGGDGPISIEYRALQLAQNLSGKAVLNVSQGWSCEGQDTPSCQTRAREEGGAWAVKVRQSGLEDRLLIVVAGGNDSGLPSPTMPTSSALIAAAVRDDLVGEGGVTVEPLTNTLVVTGLIVQDNAAGSEPERVRCLASWSFVGGDVSAVGGDVYSMLAGDDAGLRTGTSMSAPQAAGLAGYLWSIRPTLSAQQVRALLIDTAQPVPIDAGEPCNDFANPAPQIDAYRAVLALDNSTDTSPVRTALLDFDCDGSVEASDLTSLLQLLNSADGALDYGRADLNGDGYSGGEREMAMDLNADGLEDDLLELFIGESGRSINEASVTDLDAFCYLAFSPLLGIPGDGQSAAEDACAIREPGLFVQLAGVPERASPDDTAEITVTAGFNLLGGGVTFVEGIRIELELDGVEASLSSGVTSANGTFETTVTFGEDTNEMTVVAWAETEGEEVFVKKSALRNNQVEILRRDVFASVDVVGSYQEEVGVLSVQFIQQSASESVDHFDAVSTVLTRSGAANVRGMDVTGTATADLTTRVDLGTGTNFFGMSMSSEIDVSITLTNPDFTVFDYQARSAAQAGVIIRFVVWGDPASYNMHGDVSGEEYEIELDGPSGKLFDCDSADNPCSTISTDGTLPPGIYTVFVHDRGSGFIRWFEACTDCTISGTESSSGAVNVNFEVDHNG